MFSHGLITGAMFLLVGVLYDRAHTRDLNAFGGLGARMPVYAAFLIFFSLASLGLPGLSGFVAEFLTLVGAFGVWPWQTAVSVLGIVLAAVYMLKVVRAVLLGPLNETWKSLPDMSPREILSLAPLLVREMGRVIADLKTRGLSILLVEQNLPLALKVADHIHILSRGRIVHSSAPQALWANEEIKARYLGL
jgi:NADH:ubiquinone oxidoreductase subunit 5 (subunit L)/multisubunit Na+/H+ antiporter MnhA subunit